MRKRIGLALALSVAAGLGCSRGRPSDSDGGAPAGAAGLDRLHGTWVGTEVTLQPPERAVSGIGGMVPVAA